jgi:hypothetical protein
MDEQRQECRTIREPERKGSARKPYSPPGLKDYGTVADLTRTGSGTISDGRGTKKTVRP